MYAGVTGVLTGASVYYGSVALSLYTFAFWLAMHCRVIFFEEPFLIRSFGHDYVEYRYRVSRWLPGVVGTDHSIP